MVEYGITTSKAFIWAHVCPLDASIYWYRRDAMLPVMARYPVRELPSARGHLVNIHENAFHKGGGVIHDCDLGYEFFARLPWREAASDRQAGEFAEEYFGLAVRERRLTLPVRLTRYDKREDQFEGKDFHCGANYDVEVKADFPGGVWGTKNLFVQTHELHHPHSKRTAHRSEAAPA